MTPDWLKRPRVVWSSVAGLAAAAALVFAVVGPWRYSPTKDLQALVAAVGTDRTIEPRLGGGFAYGALRGPVRSGEPGPPVVSAEVRLAAAQIEKNAFARRTPETLRSLGIAYLVTGDIDHAVPVLEEAADRPSPAPQTLSDLSAAYLVRAARANQPQDLARALTRAEEAVKADPRLPEALFNRACALERLSLPDEARQAWQDYLRVDGGSPWAAEARSRAAALESKPQSRQSDDWQRATQRIVRPDDAASVSTLVAAEPEVVREWTESRLLDEWPRLVTDGRAADARALALQMRPVADAMAHQRGDAFLRDAVSAVIKASGDDTRARALADAHRLYRDADQAYGKDLYADVARIAQRAVEPLERAGSPYALSAKRYLAIGAYYAPDYPAALDHIRAVSREAQSKSYQRLLAQARRFEGLIYVVRGEFAKGLDADEAALPLFQAVGDGESEAAIHTSLAEALQFVGENDRSWMARAAALSRIDAVRDPIVRYRILQGAALFVLRDGFPEVALHIQQMALADAKRSGRQTAIITGYLTRAEIFSRLRQRHDASADLQEAQRLLEAMHDPQLISRNEARILLTRGEILSATEPAQAVAALDKALTYFDRTATSWPVASVYLARGRAHRSAGDLKSAEADFAAGIDVFERMRSRLSEALRTSYFEQPWDLFTEMVRLQVDRGQPDAALAFAERARARTLLEAVDAHSEAVPASPADARRMLPSGSAVVYYASLDDRLLIWVLTSERTDFVTTPVRQADLVRMVERWRMDRPEDRFAQLSRMYDALLGPVDRFLPPGAVLFIVPDGVLHAIPFAALMRRDTRRHLIQDHGLATVPSLTLLQRSAERPSAVRTDAASALVVGDPHNESGGAARLPEAEREAREIATMYADRQLLLDAEATKTKFVELAGRYDVVHFAGHGVSNDDYPSMSRLLFAGGDEAERSLFGSDVRGIRFDRTQLVVLAACRTSAGRIRRGEGVMSLARPFIAAGVPAVVANSWDVDDRAAHALLVAFHLALRRGAAPAEALRAAQIAALAETDPVLRDPANWANFTVIGGVPVVGRLAATAH